MDNPRQLIISPLQSDLLDLSRWVAAFLVVVEHARAFMLQSYATERHVGFLAKAFYFLTGFGHSAVMVFFVMSGFLVGGKVLERMAHGMFSWQKYAIDRGSRLYAVYAMALLLGGALDYFGYLHLNRFGLYDESFVGRIAVVNQNFHDNLSLPVFAINLGMCQTVLGPVFGSNGPLWSLANEFWYYLAGPLFFALLYRKDWQSVTVTLAILAAVFCVLPAEMLIYSLVWLMGAALYYFNFRRYLPIWLSLLLFLLSFSLARLQRLSVPFLADFLIGTSFALLINSAAACTRRLPWHTFHRKLADFSYSVYLCHFPLVVFALSGVYQFTGTGLRGAWNASIAVLFPLLLLVVYASCYGVSLVTERQTPKVRRWLYGLLGRQVIKNGTAF